MEFTSSHITLISNYLLVNWAYPYDVQGISEPFHQLSYCTPSDHNQLPKGVCPNSDYSVGIWI